MNFTSKGTREILVAGCQEQMFKVDVEKGVVVNTVGFHACEYDRTLTRGSSPWTPNTPS
jgi:primosomal replication protein N